MFLLMVSPPPHHEAWWSHLPVFSTQGHQGASKIPRIGKFLEEVYLWGSQDSPSLYWCFEVPQRFHMVRRDGFPFFKAKNVLISLWTHSSWPSCAYCSSHCRPHSRCSPAGTLNVLLFEGEHSSCGQIIYLCVLLCIWCLNLVLHNNRGNYPV